jgi:hypothetical protein
MCSPNAQCLPDGQKAYLCVCNYGYAGDGRTCERRISNFGQSIKFILSLIKAIVQKADEAAESLLIGRGMAIIKRGMAAKSNEIGGKQVKEGFVLFTQIPLV